MSSTSARANKDQPTAIPCRSKYGHREYAGLLLPFAVRPLSGLSFTSHHRTLALLLLADLAARYALALPRAGFACPLEVFEPLAGFGKVLGCNPSVSLSPRAVVFLRLHEGSDRRPCSRGGFREGDDERSEDQKGPGLRQAPSPLSTRESYKIYMNRYRTGKIERDEKRKI